MIEIIASTDAAIPWSQFGLIGTVVGALFTLVGLLIKYVRDLHSEHATSSKAERKEMTESHRAERKEWNDATHTVLKSLEQVIRESAGK